MIEGTVKINGYWYDVASKVVGAYHSRLPGKVNTGPDEFDKEQFLSNWIISDGRGGIGVDDMDESVHADRNWWTNCITDYDGHTTLPRLATEITNIPTWSAATSATDTGSGWNNEALAYDADVATGANSNVIGAGTYSEWLELNIASLSCSRIAYHYTITAGACNSMKIDVYYSAGWHALYEDANTTADIFNDISVGSTQSVTAVRFAFQDSGAGTLVITLNEVDFLNTAGTSTSDTTVKMVNFNSHLYLLTNITLATATVSNLFKLNSARTGFDYIKLFPNTATDAFVGPKGNLLIYLGDGSFNYYWVTTADVVTKAGAGAGTLGITWDGKAWKMSAAGLWWYTATPATASPTWTSQTALADIASQVERLEIGRDSDGNSVIYCSTNSILKIWNFTDNKWESTEVKLYGNQHHGKGFAYWNAALYLSYGLGVKQYTVGSTGTLSDAGLNRDGGIPAEYNGVIVKLGDGGDQMFALVDASLTTGTSQSGLYAFTGQSWRCWWADSANDGAMHDVVVSAARSAYAVYWDCGGTIFYIDIPLGLSNPNYLYTVQKYATSGIFLSPWFDAGNEAFDKLAKAVVAFTKNVTTTETITIKYRLDGSCASRDGEWTTLKTLDTTAESGQNITELASGVGVEFNSFQFRLDFARGTTTTLSPDMKALTLGYRLITQGNWSWTMTLLINNSHNTSPADKWNYLESAIESSVDIPFIYRFDPDEAHYVQFLNPTEIMAAGKEFTGQVTIQLLESWLP